MATWQLGNLASIFLVLVPEFEAARLPDVVNVTQRGGELLP